MNDPKQTKLRAARPSTPLSRLRVSVVEGPQAGRVLDPEADAVSVGSAEDNDVVLEDPTVSRYHLEILRTQAGGIKVRDLESSNGSFIGSTQIHEVSVAVGTRISIGETVIELSDGVADPSDLGNFAIPGIIGRSVAMRRVREMVTRVAASTVSVYVRGETGTGKELVARAIHDLSPRKAHPFEVVDCGSLAPTLIASELFGHERGAFTGADERRIGAFERADNGTIVLDEIGELPMSVQPALLGVLERRRFRRVGGDKDIAVDVRVVSSTHRDLRAEVNKGSFRADLFFRLAVAKVVLPALRERAEDLDDLIRHFVSEAAGDPEAMVFSAPTMDSLRAHPWSGNVRELKNVIDSALALGGVNLDGDEDKPPTEMPADAESIQSYRQARAAALEQFEKGYLPQLLKIAGHNVALAARKAQMDRAYLFSLLKRHGIR